jgi:phage-related baseplate assembly protein
MPPKFGTIAKAYIAQDMSFSTINMVQDFINTNPLSLSMYVLSYDASKKLTAPSMALKQNLRNYLYQYKIMTDAVTIKDAYYINIGVNFEIVVLPSYNNREVLSQCIEKIKAYFNIDNWQINQPIIISEMYNIIQCEVKGVQSIKNIEIVNKYGVNNGYSPYGYDIKGATKNNIIYPSLDPSIFEVRYPDTDIYGRVVNIL